MIEVADVFRTFAQDYLSAHGAAMPAWHRRAITDILSCRTPALGGHVWRCDQCSHEVFSYHSCKNRSCPKCHSKQTEQWLEARKAELLPTDYFHVTVTVPQELRALLRANQRDGYSLLMKAAAESIVELARDKRYVGGTPGVLAVLHTWTQQLVYHPHVHCLVTGGGVSLNGRDWWPTARKGFLVPHKALAKLIRGKLKALLAAKRPDLKTSAAIWRKPWVVHITHWGEGEEAVLRYLARYVFRVAVSNSRIVALDHRTVTFRYKERKSARWRTCQLDGHEFMRRFLQHVLPDRFHKVRYFGLWHPSQRLRAARARQLLQLQRPVASAPPTRSRAQRARHRAQKRSRPRSATYLSMLRAWPSRLPAQAPRQRCPWTMTNMHCARLDRRCLACRSCHARLWPVDQLASPNPPHIEVQLQLLHGFRRQSTAS